MLIRPVDENGDILPVLSSSALLSGPEAVALLAQDRLSLLRGEWWENPENGFFISPMSPPSAKQATTSMPPPPGSSS